MKVKEIIDFTKIVPDSDNPGSFKYVDEFNGKKVSYTFENPDQFIIELCYKHADKIGLPIVKPEKAFCPCCGSPLRSLVPCLVADSMFINGETEIVNLPILECTNEKCKTHEANGAITLDAIRINKHPLGTHYFKNAEIYKTDFESDLTNSILGKITGLLDQYAEKKCYTTEEDYIMHLVSAREALTDIIYNEVHSWTVRQGLKRG